MSNPRKRASTACLALALALSACATPTSYMGIPFDAQTPAVAEPGEDLRKLVFALSRYKLACKDAEDMSAACQRAVEGVVAAMVPGRRSLTMLPVGELAKLASMGDKHAQLELGTRFEEGRGVACDPGKARTLYGRAAATTGGTIWVYQPPVGNGTTGRTVPLDTGPREVGLPAASERLASLEDRLDRAEREGRDVCAGT